MSVIGSVVANLVANTREFEKGMQRSAQTVRQVGAAAQTTGVKLNSMETAMGERLGSLSKFSTAFKGFAAGGAAGFAIGAGFDLITLSINKATEAAKKFGESLTAPKIGKAPAGMLRSINSVREAMEGDRKAFPRPRVSFFDPATTAGMRGVFSDEQFAARQNRLRLQISEFRAARQARDRAVLDSLVPPEARLGTFESFLFMGRANPNARQRDQQRIAEANRRLANARAAMRETNRETFGQLFGTARDRLRGINAFRSGVDARQFAGLSDFGRMAGAGAGGAVAGAFRMFDRAVDKFSGTVGKAATEREKERKETAKAFTKELRSPFEVFQDNIREMRKAGLSGDVFARGVMRAKNQLRDALGIREPQLAAAFEKGSVAAQSAINRANLSGNDPTLKELEKIAEEQQDIADELARGIVIRELPELQVAKF